MHAQAMTETVPARVFAIAQRYPTRIGLQQNNRALNYQDLAHLSERFAHYLHTRGTRNGDVVALCMPRSVDWTVAALGVWRLGAAYMPLDSSWPDARLCFALQNSGAKAVVAEKSLLDRLGCGIQEIDMLDNAWRDFSVSCLLSTRFGRAISPMSFTHPVPREIPRAWRLPTPTFLI